jgi:hypothetical protein
MVTRQQRKQLLHALTSAFPKRSLLEQLLDFELDKKLNQITPESNLQTVVYQLIQRAEAEGWLFDLVSAACKVNPGNSQLNAIAGELWTNNSPRHQVNTSNAQFRPQNSILGNSKEPYTSSFATVKKLRSTQQRTILASGAAVVLILIGGITLFVQYHQQSTLSPSPSTSATPSNPVSIAQDSNLTSTPPPTLSRPTPTPSTLSPTPLPDSQYILQTFIKDGSKKTYKSNFNSLERIFVEFDSNNPDIADNSKIVRWRNVEKNSVSWRWVEEPGQVKIGLLSPGTYEIQARVRRNDGSFGLLVQNSIEVTP